MNKNKIKLFFYFMSFVLLAGCKTPGYEVTDAEYSGYRLEEGAYDAEDEVSNILKPFRTKMDDQMNIVIMQSTKDMRMGRPESTLGNFAADATEAMAEFYTDEEVSFAMHNYSGLRIGNIGKGDITIGRIYELMPFDNYLVTVPLSGKEVQLMCNFMAEKGGWPSSASLTYEIHGELAKNVKIDGEPISPSNTYVMATNNYVIKSAGYQDYLAEKEMTNTNVFVRDAIVEYLQSLHEAGVKLKPALDKRVVKK